MREAPLPGVPLDARPRPAGLPAGDALLPLRRQVLRVPQAVRRERLPRRARAPGSPLSRPSSLLPRREPALAPGLAVCFTAGLLSGRPLSSRFSNPQQHNCFAREGVAPDDDISDVPEASEKALFYDGAHMGVRIQREEYRAKALDARVLPRSACPGKCSGEGECLSRGAGDQGSCLCHLGFAGADCSQYVPQCYNGCSGNGGCIRGVCSCRPGWFGLDCSVDLARRKRLPGGGMTVTADPPLGRFDDAVMARPEREPDPETQRLDPRMYNRHKARIPASA